jgi:hypothetical protein
VIVWLGFFIFTGRFYGVKDVQFTLTVFREQEKTLLGNFQADIKALSPERLVQYNVRE